jgi:membrane-associated protease RseP (regulator of RpoE activity)
MRTQRKAALKRLVFVSGALAGSAVSLTAQTPCPASEQVGWLGIAGIECTNCEFGRGYARYSTEPKVVSIAPGSPAVGVLRSGDQIVSVNGALITTEEGASRLSNLKPGQSLTLLIRREGQLIPARFSNLPGHCQTEDEVSAAVAGANAVRARGQGAGTTPVPSTAPTIRARPSARAGGLGRLSAPVVAQGIGYAAHVSRVILGFGISCSDCTMQTERRNGEATLVWTFKSPPVLYSVEPEGPAWDAGLRRGDVITRIDGVDITDEDGQRRFGAVQPGQTVRFTYRRGNEVRNASVTAVAPAGALAVAAGPNNPATEAALRRMRDLLNDINQREREEQVILERLRGSDDEKLRDALTRYRAEQNRTLRELQAQLSATESRVRDAVVATPRAGGGGRGGSYTYSNTIRYSGHLGNTDIEIRGSRPVVVDESPDEIIIRTGDVEIRLKRRENR